MGVHVKFINFCIAWHWRDGCKYDSRPALKATSTSHAADTTMGQSGVFLLVEVGGVDDIAAEWCTYEVAVATFAT